MSIPLKKLSIYYGWPSTVNATYTIVGAATVFKDYDMVIFGATLENLTHPDHQNTISIINHPLMTNTEVYGYIHPAETLSSIQSSIDKWHAMGVKGIFCDPFGYDFGLTRQKQNDIVDYIHNANLKAFVNAWNPDDIFTGTPSSSLTTNDWILAESYAVKLGEYEDESEWKTRSDKFANYRSLVHIAAATTPDAMGTFSQDHLNYAYYCAALYGFETFGWGELNYSAAGGTDSLIFRTRPNILGNKTVGSIQINNGIYEIATNVGISVDTNENTTSIILN